MPKLIINVPYEVLERVMKEFPNLPPEEAIKQFLIEAALKGKKLEGYEKQGLEAFASVKTGKGMLTEIKCATPEDLAKFRRGIEDLLNPTTGKIDDMRGKLATIIELLEGIVERLREVDSKIDKVAAQPLQPEAQPAQTASRGGRGGPAARVGAEAQQPRRRRTSAIEILKEQKVMFESDITGKIKNRDAFFERLRKDGAVVLELARQRVAIDPDYWNEFVERLKSLNTNSEAEMEKVLGKVGMRLLKELMQSTLAYFDATTKKWELIL